MVGWWWGARVGVVCGGEQKMARYDEAEPLYLRCLAITEKAYGAEHKGVAASCNNLATLYQVRAPRDEGGNHHTSV